MRSKAQQISEEQLTREAIDRQDQRETAMTIGGSIPTTSYDRTKAWLHARSKQAAKLRMEVASRYVTTLIPGIEPVKRAPYVAPPKPAEVGDIVESTCVDGFTNKVINRIKRIVGV
jgi:hypothetical protein